MVLKDRLASTRRHPFVWIVWFTAVVAFVTFCFGGWLLVRDGGAAASFGWADEVRDGAWHVATVDPAGPAAGLLAPGDRLISVNDDTNVERAGVGAYRRELKIGQDYQLGVNRDGQAQSIVLGVAAGTNRLPERVTMFLVCLVWCSVGVFIGLARPDQLQARLAFAAATSVGLVFLTISAFRLSPFVSLWQPLHTVLGYHFFYRFPAGVPTGRLWSRLLIATYVGGAVAAGVRLPLTWSYLSGGAAAATGWMAEYQWLFDAQLVLGLAVFGVVVLAMVAAIVRNYRLIRDPDQRRRIRWVSYGSVLGLSLQPAWFVLASTDLITGQQSLLESGLFGLPFSTVANATTAAIPLSVAYAVVKHRVFDVKVVLRQGVRYLLAKRLLQILLLLPVVALTYTVVTSRDQTIMELVTGSTGYLYSIAALGVSLWGRRPVRLWLDRRFFREEYDREQVLVGLLDDLGRLDDVSEVSRFVSAQLEVALHPKALYLWNHGAQEVGSVYSSDPSVDPGSFPARGRLLTHVELAGAVVDTPVPPEVGLSEDEIDWLSKQGVQLLVS